MLTSISRTHHNADRRIRKYICEVAEIVAPKYWLQKAQLVQALVTSAPNDVVMRMANRNIERFNKKNPKKATEPFKDPEEFCDMLRAHLKSWRVA